MRQLQPTLQQATLLKQQIKTRVQGIHAVAAAQQIMATTVFKATCFSKMLKEKQQFKRLLQVDLINVKKMYHVIPTGIL